MEVEPAPRERKIRRGIVLLSSFQVGLGAVIIGMSFTAFASTSSAKIRGASPYWAGFMVLFTGSVGFLTWKQLSIVSIGIYTFLSTASVIVSLVATILTGDSAGFLKTLGYCMEVKFEHACECCVANATCTTPYKFPSVRDCTAVNGYLKDVMYGLCLANIICCVVCLTVTIVGCMLGAQYSRYNQTCVFCWTHPTSQQPDYDHRYNWSPFPTDPISNLPPWAPPIYYPVPNTPRGLDYQYRRPPTLFDPVDFPPPYTSREPSIAGRRGSQSSLGLEYALGHNGISWDRLGPSVFRFFGQGTTGTVSEDSFDYIDRTNVRDLGSSSGTSEGVVAQDGGGAHCMFGMSLAGNIEDGTCPEVASQSQASVSHLQDTLPSSSTESDSDSPRDNVFSSREGYSNTLPRLGPGTSQTDIPLAQSSVHVGQRRHSWSQQVGTTRSRDVYRAHQDANNCHILTNPLSQTMSEAQGNDGKTRSPITKQRANSTPCYVTDHVSKQRKVRETRSEVRDLVSSVPGFNEASQGGQPTSNWAEGNRSLFQNFTEGKKTRRKRHKKRRRPRNNPGHILEQDTDRYKEVNMTQDSSGVETAEFRETTL